jgi:metallophosphoesterase (TIGR00282 family)
VIDPHPNPSPLPPHAAETLRILLVGDVVGAPGRRAIVRLLPGLRRELAADLVVVNAENSVDSGHGVSARTAQELRDAGADVLTLGNHAWDHAEAAQAMADDDLRLVRPLNLPPDAPGQGCRTLRIKGHDVSVINLLGRVFLPPQDDPFRAADAALTDLQQSGRRPLVVVDFHAEATSEKQAMGWHLSGRASAVVGTHTHVPTADVRVLPGQTGYATDLGMVGPRDSIIGMAIEPAMRRFLSYRGSRMAVADGAVVFNAVLAELDGASGGCRSIQRVDRFDPGDRNH